MNKYSKYFKDSYGWDKFSTYLSIIGLLLIISGRYAAIFGFILIILAVLRSVSKNKYRRYRELQSFEDFSLILRQKFYKVKQNIYSFKNYKTFKCPNCSQKLRVPRHKGKIIVTCNNCKSEFKKKS
ncbi:hypothetical protein [Clostridium felsineum]|uniref:Uncharacterized protein n=1 Tax=Clostridium felsineum TaxID=36839 RepID=A0A1S8LBI5_9CLOT|nr:hypothetical protein [Clostridium felsineum]MCR3760608.1 hypothetical protein [Clostridium felsineum]URZ00470.1 hypothetical protein CLAUR_004580 [Clostridium felsineum]URZ06891.1 hypothetical protein CLROS_022240 [Clostridium felsineum]URZ11923.1 hypothetical protein CROST_026400 [Clostridium felsineum]URZ16458.1 hypothetical protein CLFE_025050 [Clostridium felsineum DSM 794]